MNEQSSVSPLMHDFEDGNGLVPAHRHVHGDGWVANTASVDRSVYVHYDARVFGFAIVHVGAGLYGDVQVYGHAVVGGDYIRLLDTVKVFGCARLFGNVQFRGETHINETPVYVEGLFPWSACCITSPENVVIIGCETHSLTHWRKYAASIARQEGAPHGSTAKLMSLLDAVYGKQRKPRTRSAKK